MTFQLTVLYHQPKDPVAFDAYYESTHAPLVQRMPGLRRFEVCRPGPGPDGGPAAEHLVAVMQWDDRAGFAASLATPEGQATTQDLGNFASGGVTLLTGELTSFV
jgi:uncharacterized protein (TIGR02118 family)